MTRIEKIKSKAKEKLEKRAVEYSNKLYKAASILDEAGGIVGGTTGGVTGMIAGAHLGEGLGRYRALAALLGGLGGGAVGAMGGSALGQAVADNRRHKDYKELLEAAKVNQRKALMDATAMRAYGKLAPY